MMTAGYPGLAINECNDFILVCGFAGFEKLRKTFQGALKI